MKEIAKKLLSYLLPALIGGGLTIAVTKDIKVVCTPVLQGDQ